MARHSPEAIAGALGVSAPTVRSDIAQLESAFKLTRPEKTLGLDNKVRPTRRAAAPEPGQARPPPPVTRPPGGVEGAAVEERRAVQS